LLLEDGKYGRRAVLTSRWADDMLASLKKNHVVELELNQAKGWIGQDVAFLPGLPQLLAFEIFDFNIRDIGPVHSLHALRKLGVTTYCSTALDFSAFPELEHCDLEWRPKATSVFECLTLQHLFVNRYDGEDVRPFGNLVNLRSLAILNAPTRSLDGLGRLVNLRSLRLANLKRLRSLRGLEELAHLEELEIHTCRGIDSIEEVGALRHLKKLHLNNDGPIASLRPLEKLIGLESVLFYESTNILDGDLSPLLRQKHLSNVSFQNRRHYSHRREDFGAAYSR
jgi:hypothetical protein